MIAIKHKINEGHHCLKIDFADKDEGLNGLIIFYNSFGDEIKRLKLKGNNHNIDLSFFDQALLYVKIETEHNTIMKKISLESSF